MAMIQILMKVEHSPRLNITFPFYGVIVRQAFGQTLTCKIHHVFFHVRGFLGQDGTYVFSQPTYIKDEQLF
jgi:hypothetical protein